MLRLLPLPWLKLFLTENFAFQEGFFAVRNKLHTEVLFLRGKSFQPFTKYLLNGACYHSLSDERSSHLFCTKVIYIFYQITMLTFFSCYYSNKVWPPKTDEPVLFEMFTLQSNNFNQKSFKNLLDFSNFYTNLISIRSLSVLSKYLLHKRHLLENIFITELIFWFIDWCFDDYIRAYYSVATRLQFL